eukprot:3494936-Amphidinium_carterae.1
MAERCGQSVWMRECLHGHACSLNGILRAFEEEPVCSFDFGCNMCTIVYEQQHSTRCALKCPCHTILGSYSKVFYLPNSQIFIYKHLGLLLFQCTKLHVSIGQGRSLESVNEVHRFLAYIDACARSPHRVPFAVKSIGNLSRLRRVWDLIHCAGCLRLCTNSGSSERV